MAVRIMTDSACDLPPELIARLGITVVPLHVSINGHDVSDTWPDPDRFWAEATRLGGRPRTAAPAPGAVAAAARPLIEAGDQVLALTLTGKISAVYQSFLVAAQGFGENMQVFDTWSLSLGEGIQVWEAARLAQAGATMPEILAYLRELRARVRLRAVLDTIDWAKQGGRIAYLMPLIRRVARTFRVKVLLHVVEGRVLLLGVQRSYRRALEALKEHTLHAAPIEHVLIPHTRHPTAAAALADELAVALNISRDSIVIREAGPILAAHVGPHAVGVVVTERL